MVNNIMDLLTFKNFISIEVLIIFYYIGAILLPVSIRFFIPWVIRKNKLAAAAYKEGENFTWKYLQKKQKIKMIILIVTIFIFTELIWRILFEFLIAYMQIRNALLQAITL